MSTATGGSPGPAHRARDTTRWDIQGLRAFAVLAVVVYHLWPARLHGGFVGVDVFFVISGYLITGHLLREQIATGRIRLGQFWSRRAKRLLPGAFLTIIATGIAVLTVVPSALWEQYGRELIASTVYAQNWELAASSVDYLDADNAASPFQHFWSLSVEEQFYIALPLLLLLLTLAVRNRVSPLTTARILLGTVVALSLVWCVVQTNTNPGVAYFSTATRAWEFALGGLAATVRLPVARTTVALAVRGTGAAVGAVALIASLVVITPATPFPGIAAALPVVGATLMVLFGSRTVFESLGAIPPIAFVGRISYSLYLWHWPLVVIVPMVLGHPLGWKSKLAVLVASLALAAVTTKWFEEPLRFSGVVRRLRPGRVAVVGVVCTLAVVALGASTLVSVHVQQVQAATYAKELTAGHVPCFGAAAEISAPKPCVDPRLADVLVPAPAAAKEDDPNPKPDETDPNFKKCWTGRFDPCVLGKATGFSKHLLVIGDSHSNSLLGAYEKIATDNGWRIDLAGIGGCYLTTAKQDSLSDSTLRSCTKWKQQAIRYVRQHRDADALVVVHSTTQMPVSAPEGAQRDAATLAGLKDAWEQAAGDQLPVIAIRDNPVPRRDVITCVSAMAHPTDGTCDQPRSEALGQTDSSAEAVKAFRADGGTAGLIDLSKYYCTDTTCPAVIGGVLVYRDTSHITGTWAMSLEPYLERDMKAQLASFAR
ncbi:Peptidoglycan/LPS O-acetylase OafA/YrhL, contains acyltransferase and SGNH-hydrolase domains [Curtobacterium sp. UNCCL20]|uniref:acyltransferase family protein n=1 Tax=Curtobacterium sp. UNCCL20 TaxID=1502773 RepID=UPI0008923F49|nr:acyltransferase family protein [Curtobacterium sp. UNCCL20]SDQ63173.1 Peptidoglycan/LPS O-acetylase OafA/YrhL, contains acyltransferase and SGNH-hydrolase domains [Curtobacterium sp. UNCCL20]